MTHTIIFEKIKDLIHTEKISTCTDATIEIREKGRQATLNLVKITSVGVSAFAIKLDECGFPGTSVFKPHDSLHRACDAIVFCEVEARPYILCCELKSSAPTRKDVAEQFRNAHCFLEYLNVLLQHYCDCSSISDWPRRYFVFHGGGAASVSKRPSREEHNNQTPETALFIPVQNGHKDQLRRLLGKPL